MSMDASGGFGGTLVYGKWKGRNTVRQLVTPSNPRTDTQEDARNRLRTVGVGQHWANLATTIKSGQTLTDKNRLIAAQPSGQAWNGFLGSRMIGAGFTIYTAMLAAWAALSAGEKTAWNTAAAALTPAIPAVFQTDAGGVAGTPLTAGNAFFAYQYGLYQALNDAVPGATPPTYA